MLDLCRKMRKLGLKHMRPGEKNTRGWDPLGLDGPFVGEL